jgi:hypothetical protein
MFPVRLLIGALALFVVIALTPPLLKVFGTRPVETVVSRTAPIAAATAPLAAKPEAPDSRQQAATALAPADVRSRPGTDQISPDMTGSVPQASAPPPARPESGISDPSPAIELPAFPPAASTGAKVKRARRPTAVRKIASRQLPNSFEFGPQPAKPASTEYKPVPLPPPNFTNSGY